MNSLFLGHININVLNSKGKPPPATQNVQLIAQNVTCYISPMLGRSDTITDINGNR